MKVIITGGRGLVGAKFVAAYQDQYELVPLTNPDGSRVDITDESAVARAIEHHADADALIHLAAYTDVNGAFAQTGDQSGPAWQVNVVGTRYIATQCAAHGIYLIHMSTAFVFDGSKDAPYTETDTPHPIEWYGQTKYESEQMVTASKAKSIILRIDQPFSAEPSPKVDTLWRVIGGLQSGKLYPQFTNHYFGPTAITDLAHILDWCLRTQPTGILHASNGERWSDYEFASAVAGILDLPGKIEPGDLETYLRTTQRPYQRNTALDVTHLRGAIDFPLGSIRDEIARVKKADIENK